MSKLVPRFPKTTPSVRKFHSRRHIYEIPERYRNSFYLANAALFDSVSWFLHRAYEVCFSDLIEDFAAKNPPSIGTDQAVNQVEEVIKLLDQCNSVVDVRYPIKRNNGRYDVIRGFRAQHGLASGHSYCLGGLRISQNITRDHMKALATLSTYKHAFLGLNMAGGWGGIKVDPINYNENELKLIVEGYVSEMLKRGYFGRNDLIEPDINSSKREMMWISTAKKEKSMSNTDETITAGSNEEIASQAISFALEHFLNQPKILDQLKIKDGGLKNKTYIIQGLGKLGSALAKYLSSNGATCVGAKEHDAYIYNSKGIDVKALLKHKNEHGSIINFDVTKPCVNDDVYTKECDILILAALQKSLGCHTAPNVKAKIIVEAADGAITPTSHRIFTYSKLVLPDIFISSAYHVACLLECSLNSDDASKVPSFVQDIYKNFLDTSLISQGSQKVMTSGGGTQQKLKTFNKKHDIIAGTIEHVLTETTNDIVKIADQYKLGLDYRTAAYIKSLKYIFGSIQKNRAV